MKEDEGHKNDERIKIMQLKRQKTKCREKKEYQE